jgi:hypothetical protein
MRKIFYLLFATCLFCACSSDDKDDIDAGEKIPVTAKDIVGAWEYTDNNDLKHQLNFQSDEVKCIYLIYRGESIRERKDFTYTISGIKISVIGGIFDTYETEIFKRGEKLYFKDMPFTPYKKQ